MDGAWLCLAEPVREGLHDLALHRRVLRDERAEAADVEHEEPARIGGDRGRRARAAVDKGDLAQEVARPELVHLAPVPLDPHAARDDDEELPARRALTHEHAPGLHVDLVHQPADRLDLAPVEAGEERHRGDELELRIGRPGHRPPILPFRAPSPQGSYGIGEFAAEHPTIETRACSADNKVVDPLSRLLRGRTRRALLLLLPGAAGFAALLSTLTLGVTAGEAGLVVAAATGLWFWLGTVRTRVEESRQLALTDDLTGLGNRRRLLGDLGRAIGEGTDHAPSALAMFDLDGFKAYNDTHGHPAGDALLAQLGARLPATLAGSGAAYRLGGDEFCVLLHGSPAQLERALTSALEALTDEEADVRPSYGFALLPREARDPSSALRIVDQRMYAQKDGRRASTKRQARDLLLAVLDQHAPDLRAHSDWVSDLARSVGHRL